jgi:hypothetical protein
VPNKSDTRHVFSRWEQEDKYYTGMPKSDAGMLNMKARRHPYLETSESKPLSMLVNSDVPVQGPVTLVYLNGQAEAGLPHTRGSSGIALPVFLLWSPNDQTMRHELVHLSQKQMPQLWWAWYRTYFQFRKATDGEIQSIPLRRRERRRINPDTLAAPYTVWEDRYIPLSVFLSDLNPDLRHCKRGFWDLETMQWTWECPPGWESMFGTGFNDEHPHEIIAHWIDGSAGEAKRQYFHLHPI